jgi:hypothetical protein
MIRRGPRSGVPATEPTSTSTITFSRLALGLWTIRIDDDRTFRVFTQTGCEKSFKRECGSERTVQSIAEVRQISPLDRASRQGSKDRKLIIKKGFTMSNTVRLSAETMKVTVVPKADKEGEVKLVAKITIESELTDGGIADIQDLIPMQRGIVNVQISSPQQDLPFEATG